MPRHRQLRIAVHLRAVRRSLTTLGHALRRLADSTRDLERNGAAPPTRRKLTLSPARRAALKLQGTYMGYLRNLKPKQKAQVKALRVKKGPRAAIALAKQLAKG